MFLFIAKYFILPLFIFCIMYFKALRKLLWDNFVPFLWNVCYDSVFRLLTSILGTVRSCRLKCTKMMSKAK